MKGKFCIEKQDKITSRNSIRNRAIAIFLLVIMLFSCSTQLTFSKYVLTGTGRAMASMISGNVFTEAFALSNESFFDENGNPKDEATSESLHGIGATKNDDGSYTVKNVSSVSGSGLNSTSNKSFVVQNNSDYDLVACFDILLCMGLINNSELTCTITAPSTVASSNEKTTLIVSASLNNNGQGSEITLNHHKKPSGGGEALPVVDVQLKGILGNEYEAYSMQINPTDFMVDRDGDGQLNAANELTRAEFESFILIRSGESKTFEFGIDADQNIIGDWLSKNCYASVTMTVKKYTLAP